MGRVEDVINRSPLAGSDTEWFEPGQGTAVSDVMKRILMSLLAFILFTGVYVTAKADNLAGTAETAQASETMDKQLTSLYDLSVHYAAELEKGGWDVNLTFEPAGEIPKSFLPDLKNALKTEILPETLKESKFIALYADETAGGRISLLGDFQVRLPEINRAATLEEADAVLILSERLADRKDYIGTASDRVYEVFAAPKNGTAVCLYTKITTPSQLALEYDSEPAEKKPNLVFS